MEDTKMVRELGNVKLETKGPGGVYLIDMPAPPEFFEN